MKACPRYDSKEWIALLEKAGSTVAAFRVFIRNNYDIPTLAEIADLPANKADVPLPVDRASVENRLLGTKLFERNKRTGFIVLKYSQANQDKFAMSMAAIGAENSIINGLVKVQKGLHGVHFVQIQQVKQDGQQEIKYDPLTTPKTSTIATTNYTRVDVQANPNVAYVFTENTYSITAFPTRSGGGSAVIRPEPNAFAIVTKKKYDYNTRENVDYSDTEEDFQEFVTINTALIKKLKESEKVNIVFPQGFATDKATMPTRFAEWLQKELLANFGLITELNSKKTGLISKEIAVKQTSPVIQTTPKTNPAKPLLMEGFTSFQQQQETVDVMASHILAYMKKNTELKAGKYGAAVDSFIAEITALNTARTKEIYRTILENQEELSKAVFDKLANKLKIINPAKLEGTSLKKDVETKDAKEEDEQVVEGEKTETWRDEWVFQYDAKDNALEQLKKFLAFIPKTKYNEKTNQFRLVPSVVPNQPVFLGYDEVYEGTKALLAGVENTWEAMEAELRKHEKAKPYIHAILTSIERYKEDKEQLKRQFVSSMSSTYSGFQTILVKPKYITDTSTGLRMIVGKYFNIIDTDQASVEKVIVKNWQGDFKRSKLYKVEKGGLVVDYDAVKAYQERIEEAKNNPTKENIKELLSDIGITITEATLTELVEGVVNRLPIAAQFTQRNGLFRLINLRLSGKTDSAEIDTNAEPEEGDALVNDPMVNNSAIRALAKVEAGNNDYYYSNTFKDGENNTVYSYTFNKFITKEFRELTTNEGYVKQLLDITFNKPIMDGNSPIYETWLHLLNTNPTFKAIFKISPLDTIRLAGPNNAGIKLTSMSELDLEMTKLALIQNSGQRKKGLLKNEEHQDGARIIKYLLTVPSKTTSYVVQGTGHEVKLFFSEGGAFRLDKATKDALYSIAASEHNRILSQQARKSANKAYDDGSGLFYFFPTLQDKVTVDGKVLLPTDKIGDKTVEEIIKEELEVIVRKDIIEKTKTWERLGIVKENRLVEVDNNYQYKILNGQTTDPYNQVTLAAADYVINSMISKFNAHQTFIDDPAIYFKKGTKKGTKQEQQQEDIKSTWDNIGKRLTNLIAPFKDGMLDSTNRDFLTVKLQDREVAAWNLAQLKARLSKYYDDNDIQLPYEKIEGTDAQEYVTLKEELKVAYMYGGMKTAMYEDILARYKKDEDALVLTKEELEFFFVPRKPVYSSRNINKEDDAVYRTYIKSASVVLLPQFTKGLEIDKLRKAMESLEVGNLTVRAAFNTATKLGGFEAADIWNTDGTIKDGLDLSPYKSLLQRSNFGIQQEVPYDEYKDEVIRSTQVFKLLFDSLDEIGGFRYNKTAYNGKELKQLYTDLQEKLYEKGLTKLESKLLDSSGNLIMSKVITLLSEEGIKRGYTPAQLSFLRSNIEGTDFNLPFWSHVNNDKEQSMLTSLWTNNVLKQKMPGGSYVLVSEEGMQGRSEGILYTKEYDPATGLKPMRIVYKKDKEILEQDAYDKLTKAEKEGYTERVKPAQVIISWNLRDKTGKLVDRSKYITTDEDGKTYLDTKKVPKQLLEQFGFRIPNQGHNSMGLIEIVGFLPDVYAGMVITSRNFITQMGSDFDVDKLYIYNYFLDNDADGNLSIQKNTLQNQLVDIHKSVLYNPNVFNQVTKPLDLGKLKYKTKTQGIKGIAQDLKQKEEERTGNVTNYLNPDYDRNKYLQSVDGKSMVGLTSTGNVFSTLMQGKEISLQRWLYSEDAGKEVPVPDFIIFADKNGDTITLSDLSSALTLGGRKKNEIHQGIQSAAVDNEKDPILSYINSSPQISSVATLLMDLGLEEELYLFLAQPILVDYASKMKQYQSELSPEYVTDQQVLEQLTNKKVEEALLVKLQVSNLANVPIGENEFNKVLFGKGESRFTEEEIQTLVLAKFKKLKDYGDVLQRAQNLFNIESKGVGKSMLDLADKRKAIDGMLSNPKFKNIHRISGELVGGKLEATTITGYGITNAIYAADDTIRKAGLMPFNLKVFDDLFKQYDAIIKRETNAEQKYEIWKAVKAYNYSKLFTEEQKKAIFFDSPTNKSLNSRISALQRTSLKANPFVLRLDLSQTDLSGKTPSLVFYNSSKEADIEETNIYQGLIDLVFNEDQEIRSIGEDLIKYFFMNGGTPGAKDWARYIDTHMMTVVGVTDFARTVDFNSPAAYGFDTSISEVLLQLFQHKPYLAPSPKDISNLAIKEGILVIPKDKIPKEVVQVEGVSPIINIKGTLFKFKGISQIEGNGKGGNFIFERIEERGSKFYLDYKAVENTDNKYQEKVVPESEAPGTSTDEYKNPAAKANYEGLVEVSLKTALSSISNSTIPYYQQLAKQLLALEGLIGNVKVTAVLTKEEEARATAGQWDGKTIKVNIANLSRGGRSAREWIETTILKEAIHTVHTKLFRSEFTPTAEQLAAKEGFIKLFETAREHVLSGNATGAWNKGDFVKYEQLLKKMNSEGRSQDTSVLTTEERDFMRTNKALYYGLTNVEDFVHDALLEPEFMKALNSLAYTADKSVLQQLYDFILQVLESFKGLVDIKEGTALEASFNYLVAFTASDGTVTTQTVPDDNGPPADLFYDINVVEDPMEDIEEPVKFKKILNDFNVRLNNIRKDIAKARAVGDKELAATLINRLAEVKSERDFFVTDNNIETVVTIATSDLAKVEEILNKEVVTANDLTYIRTVLGTWTNIGNPEIYDVLTGIDIRRSTPKKLEIDKIIAKANELKRRSDEAHIEIMHNEAQKELGKPVSREDLTQVSDIGIGQAQFRDISSSDNVVLNVMSRWLRKAALRTTTELNAVIARAEELTKPLHEKGISSREDMARVFGQVDKDGNLTGEIVDALSVEYFKTRDILLKAVKEAPNPGMKKKAAEAYYNWIKENHIIVDPTKLYTVGADGIFVVNEDPDYLVILKEQLGEDYEQTVQHAKDLVTEYNAELSLQILYYKDRADAAKMLEIWRLQNSPNIYIDNLKNGLTIRQVEGETIYNQGWKYISKRAKKEWEDTKYNAIQEDADIKAYYDWYKETLNNLYQYLPYDIRRNLKTTEIPNIEKTLIQELHDAGATKYVNRTWSALLENISVSAGEFATGINPATGTFDKEFKFAYLDKIDPQHKSYDLTATLKLFAAQAIGFKNKSQIEDQVRLAEATLKSALEKQMMPNGLPRLDKYGKSTTLKGLKRLYEQMDYAVDVFYGDTKDHAEGKTNMTYITPKDKERLAEEIAKIDAMEVPDAVKEGKKKAAIDKFTRAFSWSKLGDAILQYIQLKGMGWNVFGGVNNMLFGQMANYNWAATGVDFSDEDMTKAVGLMLSAQTGANSAMSAKIEALMVKFNTVKQLRDKIYSATTNYNAARKGIEKLAPFELYAQGEYFVQGQVMVALLNSTKVTVVEDGVTKTISVFDALNDKGEWDTARFGENKEWDMLGDSSINFKFKLDALLKKIHGNYDPDSPMLISKHFLGRALIQFRRWIPEGVAQRFDSEKYDIYLQRSTKGRYLTYGDLGFKQSIKTLVKMMYQGDEAFEGLELNGNNLDVVKENMKKNLREIYFKLSLVAMYFIISGLAGDDDDEWTKKARNYSLNTILRLEDDIEFYYSPVAMDNITRSFLPAMNIVGDSYKFMDAVVETAAGDPLYKSGVHSGESKVLWRGLRLIPFGSSVSGIISKTETAETFRK